MYFNRDEHTNRMLFTRFTSDDRLVMFSAFLNAGKPFEANVGMKNNNYTLTTAEGYDALLKSAYIDGVVPVFSKYPQTSLSAEDKSSLGDLYARWQETRIMSDLPVMSYLQGYNVAENSVLREISVELAIAFLRITQLFQDTEQKMISITPNLVYTMYIDYLLSVSICFLETFNGVRWVKTLATRNVELAKQYATPQTNYVPSSNELLKTGVLHYYTIVENKRGKEPYRVSLCKTPLMIDESTNVCPMYFLYRLLDILKTRGKEDYVGVLMRKDNGDLRHIVTSFSITRIDDVYKNIVHSQNLLERVTFKARSATLEVPEVGLPTTDATGTRIINLARVHSFHKVDEVDKSYLNIELNSVITRFNSALLGVEDISILTSVYEYVAKEKLTSMLPTAILKDLIRQSVNKEYEKHSTTFLKDLHTYMVGHTDIFIDYTGLPTPYNTDCHKGIGFNLGT